MTKISLHSLTLIIMGLMSLSAAHPVARGRARSDVESGGGTEKSGKTIMHRSGSNLSSGHVGSRIATENDGSTVTSSLAENDVEGAFPRDTLVLSGGRLDSSSLSLGYDASDNGTNVPSATVSTPHGSSGSPNTFPSIKPSTGRVPSFDDTCADCLVPVKRPVPLDGSKGDISTRYESGGNGGEEEMTHPATPSRSTEAVNESSNYSSSSANDVKPNRHVSSTPPPAAPTGDPEGTTPSILDDLSSRDPTSSASTGASASAVTTPSGVTQSDKRIATKLTGSKSGKATWYNPGLGSCGEVDSDSDLVVALAIGTMSGRKNCNKSIRVTDPKTGKTATAKVRDACPSCALNDLDMSPSLFQKFQPLDIGTFGVDWNFE